VSKRSGVSSSEPTAMISAFIVYVCTWGPEDSASRTGISQRPEWFDCLTRPAQL